MRGGLIKIFGVRCSMGGDAVRALGRPLGRFYEVI
jgi:hypothetical protein